MSGEERAEVAARLMSNNGKLDEGEVEELREVWEDVCCTHVKAVFGRLARRVGETEAEDLGQEVLADAFWAVCDGPPASPRLLDDAEVESAPPTPAPALQKEEKAPAAPPVTAGGTPAPPVTAGGTPAPPVTAGGTPEAKVCGL